MSINKKFMDFIERRAMPVVNIISNNKILLAIRDGLVLAMPVMIIGSIAIIIGDFPVQAFQDFMASVFGESWNWWNWDVIYPSTMGIVAIFTTFGIAYSLAKSNEVEPLPAGMIAITAFFLLLIQQEGGGYDPNDFGAQSLFTGMLTAIASTEIYTFVIRKKMIIKMPESVPVSISRSFTALIPAGIVVVVFVIVRALFALTPYGSINEFILNVLQIPLLGVGTSLIGTIITAGFFNTFFWIFGIHGTLIVQSVMQPIWDAAKYVNLAAYQAGEALPYIVTTEYLDHFVFLSGSGITLPLCIMMLWKSRSRQLKELGKLAIIPSLFNVNEPIIYGLPIVMNPIMAIPFFITPMISILLSYTAMALNIVGRPTGVAVPFTTPAPFGGFLITGDVKVALLQILVFIIAGLIYWPFFRVWDKKCAREEGVLNEAD